ncbi:MAG: methyltransferase [Caldilineaceae bacterium]
MLPQTTYFPNLLVLSHFQAALLLKAKQADQVLCLISTDLGLTRTEVKLQADFVEFANGERLVWSNVEEIAATEIVCFQIADGVATPIRQFSEEFGRTYSLLPTESAPTMMISGISMHRIKGANPYTDTLNKIKAIAPIRGEVLDTTTGLGYTAIEAVKTAAHVTTVELDPVAQEIARLNPWSQALFANPKITQLIGDSFDVIQQFGNQTFDSIIHDPPMFSMAGELYSGAFYQQAFRVLKRNGRMFHYIGSPDSQSGARITKGVVRRLQAAGFTRIVPKPQAFGVMAYK